MLNLLVDIHGVVANFFQAFCEYHEIPEVYDNWPKGKYDLYEVTGIPWNHFPIEYLTDIPETEDIEEIMTILQNHNIAFANRAYNPNIALAIMNWINKRFAPVSIFTCQVLKADAFPEIIQQNIILIDDCEEEVNAWRAKGGRAILLPRPWNSAKGNSVEVLEDQILFMECVDSYLINPDLGESWNEN